MTHIRRLTLHLPARFAGLGPEAARQIATQLVTTAGAQAGALQQGRVVVPDQGQHPQFLGAAAGRALARRAPREGEPQ